MERRAAVVLDAVPEAPRRARRFLAENLTDWERPDLTERAALALSELVTNAFLHAHGEIEVVISLGTTLRVEVRDSGARRPLPRHYSVLSATGRGLRLVEQTVDRWGTTPSVGRKSVWFELDADRQGDLVAQDSRSRAPADRKKPRARKASQAPSRELGAARPHLRAARPARLVTPRSEAA
jgi:anti-sigma regulatory factor (Ser/Thr protein kinase)